VGTAAAPETATALQGTIPAFQIAGSGLIDIALDPDFASNQTIYVSTMEGSLQNGANLAIYRARISGTTLADVAPIWRSPVRPADNTLDRIGGFMAFRDGLIHMAVGDFGVADFAQDSVTPFGKVVRIQKDGSAAPGNPLFGQPFVNNDVFTIGHRDPQGLTLGSDGRLYETELAPRVGDEVNVIEFNRNYGWPLVSEGTRDDGTPFPRHSALSGAAAPVFFWTTDTRPSRIIQVRSARDGLKDELLVASVGNQAVQRLAREGNAIVERERIPVLSPTRTVAEAPDGRIYGTTSDLVDGVVFRVDRR
jgi:glucose/arabinose dehydrogenase